MNNFLTLNSFKAMRYFSLIFMLFISVQSHSQQIISVGGGISLVESSNYTNGVLSKSANFTTRASAHVQLTYHSENLFWGGLLVGAQDRGVLMEEELTRSVFLQDFVENRIQVMMGFSQTQSNSLLLPYVGLNLSFITIDAPIFELFENYNTEVPKGWNPSPSVELGCQWIAPRINEHKVGVLNRLSIRYYPLGVINHEEPILATTMYTNNNIPIQNKTIEISYSLGLLFHVKLKRNSDS